MPKIPQVTIGRGTGQPPETRKSPSVTIGKGTGEALPVRAPSPVQTLVFGSAQAQAGVTAPSLVIRELGGDKRQVFLSERALPYRGLPFVSEMRMDEGEYVGYPRISQTPLGAKELETQIGGCWKDVFLGRQVNGVAIANVLRSEPPTFSDGALNVSLRKNALTSARDLCDLFEDMVYSAHPVRVTWLHLRRLGRVARFEQNWLNPHDCEWKILFKWIGRDEQIGLPSPARTELVGLAKALSSSYTELHEATNFDGLDGLEPSFADAVDTRVGQIQRAVLEISDAIETRAAAVPRSIDALRRATALSTLVRDQAQILIDTLDASVAPAMIVVGAIAPLVPGVRNVVDQLTVNAGRAIAAACQQRGAVRAARATKHTAARQRFSALRAVGSDVIAIVAMRDGQDLRDIAQRFYGRPDDWDQIRSFNNLPSSTAPAGTLVFVPAGRRGAS